MEELSVQALRKGCWLFIRIGRNGGFCVEVQGLLGAVDLSYPEVCDNEDLKCRQVLFSLQCVGSNPVVGFVICTELRSTSHVLHLAQAVNLIVR